MENQPDRPGVVILPPLLMALALLLVSIVLSVSGIGSAAWGRITLVKSGTNVNPLKPTTAIVTGGPFRLTRNPLYVSIMSLFVGLSLLIGTWWGLVLLISAFLILHYGVVLREEAYLERKFGDSYRSYKSVVRRYL
jgi:protein-S-isoprenylcysteine O-methyltransferase Ste14